MEYKISEFNCSKHIRDLFGKGIYKIETKDGRLYIGSTSQKFKKRWCGHVNDLVKDKHHSQYLQNVFNKYGADFFSFSIVELVEDKSNIIAREQYWIDLLQPELNMLKIAGSCLGHKHSEETRMKQVEKWRKRDYAGRGVHFSKKFGKYKTTIHVRSIRLHIGHYDDYEQAVEARKRAELTFWNEAVDSLSEEDLKIFIKKYKADNYKKPNKPSKSGHSHIDYRNNRYIFNHQLEKTHYKRFKTLEEAIKYKEEYFKNLSNLEAK